MKLTLDVENTVTHRGGKLHLDPFEADNKLVMVGCLTDTGKEYLYRDDFTGVQELLDQATVLIGHNIVHDLLWLWECGFKYDGTVFDTMLGEYILQRGQKEPLSLEACAIRHDLDTKKQDTMKEYFKNHTSVDQRGFTVDTDALDAVRIQFEQEKQDIEKRLNIQVKELMGDTPINLNSPEQMSWVIYSRKPLDKTMWANNFTPYMDTPDYKHMVATKSTIMYKTKAEQCNPCSGTGYIRKVKKDGTPFARPTKCDSCDSVGYLFIPDKMIIGGLKFNAPNAKWVSNNGFSVNKNNLGTLYTMAKHKKMTSAMNFLSDLQRLSALDTYLSSFVEGIQTHIKPDGKLHVRLLQHRTATGRFSGADPNMQNMPRGGTFPVKKVFVSRWKGGKILEADFAQLEFRAAAFLSQDQTAMKEIEDGFDVHSYTARVISDAGEKTSRQEAKAHTFAPLYGATGFGRTPSQATYYKHFTEKYKGIALWHTKLAKEVMTTGRIKIPSGREFSFPDAKRYANGKITNFTQVKNYPVQSFATADIVPLILMHIDKLLSTLKSCVVNSVHDSIVIDIHPEEEKQVLFLLHSVNQNLLKLINTKFGIDFNVPLLLEAKIGNNWLDTKDVI